MDTKPWPKDKLSSWKNFWESEMGQEALAKMEKLKMQFLESAMHGTGAEGQISYCVGRAAGVDTIIQDIKQGILSAEEAEKAGKEDVV